MSTRDDATLSAQERAAFARIEAQVIAQDPRFRASVLVRMAQRLRRMGPVLRYSAAQPGVGPVAVIVGIAEIALGLTSSIALAITGLVLVVAGTIPIVDAIRVRVLAASVRNAALRQRRNSSPPTS